MNQATSPPATPPLTDEQWQGLARLADLMNAVSGPFAGPLTGMVNRSMALATRYDTGALAEELLDTTEALRASGLLTLLRDNAELIAESIRQLTPLLAKLPNNLADLPLSDLGNGLSRLHAWLDKADVLGAYVSENFAGPAVGWSVEAVDFARREELSDSLVDVLKTVGHLHRNGTLSWLREISDTVELRRLARLLDGVAGDGVSSAASISERARTLFKGVQDAMHDAEEDSGHLGGIGGLLHLLRDSEVQQGLRALAVLPTYLDGKKDD